MASTPHSSKPGISLTFSLTGLFVIITILTSVLFGLICSFGISKVIEYDIRLEPDILTGAPMVIIDNLFEQHCLLLIIAVCVFICIISVALGIHVSKLISRPLMGLVKNMEKLSDLNLEEDLSLKSRIMEVGKMQETIEDLRSGLKSFRKYVPAGIVTDLLKQHKEAALGVEKRELTIYFSDIVGFTSLSEQLAPEELIEQLSLYFHGITQTIIKNKGTIDKYIGDAIMAFWGAPAPLENHAAIACIAALQCQRYIYGISREWTRKGLPPLKTRVGVHTGDALVGNIGYEERLNYTAVGDNVNIASRLEGLNKFYGTDMLISESTFQRAQNAIEARLIDVVVVKGKTKGIPIYELIGEKYSLSSEYMSFLNLYNRGIQEYLSRNWAGARDMFHNAAKNNPEDRPVQILLKRCTNLSTNPPPSDWCGEIVMRGK